MQKEKVVSVNFQIKWARNNVKINRLQFWGEKVIIKSSCKCPLVIFHLTFIAESVTSFF